MKEIIIGAFSGMQGGWEQRYKNWFLMFVFFSLGNRKEGDKEYIEVAAIWTGRFFKMFYL